MAEHHGRHREGGGMVDEKQESPERKRGGRMHEHEHHKRARGGGIGEVDQNDDTKTEGMEVYSGAGSKTIEKANKRKAGGAIPARKRGGKVHKKEPMHVEGGKMMRHRMDRPGRKRGGSIGADTSPLTEAARLTPAEGQKSGFRIGKGDD
jgi:hypothetical protein